MSLVFDGVDDRVSSTSGTGIPNGTPMSMCCVIRMTSFTNFPAIIQCGDDGVDPNYGWYINTSGLLDIYCGTLDVFATTAIVTGAWLFIGVSSATTTSHRYFCYNYETNAVILNETSTLNPGSFAAPGGGTFQLGAFNFSGTYANFLDGEIAWLGLYTKDFTIDTGSAFQALAFLGPYAFGAPNLFFDFLESSGTAARERIANQTWTLTNFPASPWRAVNLPGPWWTRSAHRVIRPQAVAAATDPGLLHYNAPGNQLTPHYPMAVPF